MPDAKSRKDRKPSAPKRAAPQRTSQVEGHGKNSRRWRWSSTLICLVGIQALAVLSLWHSHSFNPPRVEPAVPPVLELEAIPIPPESSAPGPDFVGDTAREGDIAVLLIASGRSVSSLKQTLKSLLRNFPVSSILVSQAAPGEASRELAVDLGVSWVGPSPITDWAIFDGEAEPWLHYGRSLDYAVTKHFGEKFRSLFVAEEDLIFSSGLYSFLSQLHPLLFQDESLWCISAWNDYSFSSFVKDVSVVLRSDWFAGRAFMVTLQLIRQELLPNWSLQQRWRPLLRQLASAGSKECLMPEVSRAAFTSYQCDSVGIRGQCDEEEVEARRNAPVSIFARGDAKLGDVQRLKNTRYLALLGSSWPKNGALQKARCITVLQELYEDATTPLLVVIDDKERTDMSTWAPVLDYFGLPPHPDKPRGPRNTYHGVVRLRWRETVLYLASLSSPFLRPDSFGKPIVPMSPKEFELLPGSRAHRSTGLLPPVFISPWSHVTVADVGSSCLLHCASQGELCVDADLASVARCSPPLTDLLRCSTCNEKADSSVFPGLQMRTETCFAAPALPNFPSSKFSKCSTQQEGVQRLCVCRRASQVPLDLQSASSHFVIKEKDAPRSRAFSATKEHRSRPNLQRFGDLLPAGSIPNSLVTPDDLSILLVVPDGATETLLQRTLTSLSQTQGFMPSNALLAHSQAKLFIADLAEGAQIERIQVQIDQRIKREMERLSALYQAAFEGFQKSSKSGISNVVVLSYGDLLAPDALWYFAQLAPVLQKDDSLWAVNGWNDQGIAPYAADPTVILRTDWFSGSGWMVTAQGMKEIASLWRLGRPWEALFRDSRLRMGRQFLMPEMSRVIPDSGWTFGETLQKAGLRLDPYLSAQTLLCDIPVVDLGDVDRLMEQRYKRLFFIEWPGEGLLKTKLLSSLQSLLDGKVNSGGPFRLVYRNVDLESDTTWKGVAKFFNLWPELPMRGAYHGVIRLRWRDTVLFLVPSSSPFCTGELREALLRPEEDAIMDSILPPTQSQILDPMRFPMASPLLVPANSELLPADLPGISCEILCEEAGLRCHPEDLPFINNCDALAALGCRRCEADEGPEQPAQELQGPKAGRCLYNSNLGKFPLTCDAAHAGTRRLCICREVMPLTSEVQRKVVRSTSSPQPSAIVQETTRLPAFLEALAPETLAILVLAGSQRPRVLERCLQSLSEAHGYNKNMIFVSQDGDGTQTKIMAQKFHVAWHQVDTGRKSAGEKEALHYKMALEHAMEGPFRDKSALIILEEDMVVSFDFLVYFAQLLPLLKWDDIFSVSAWNENAIGPLTFNPQHLLRVDPFSGVAWMVSMETLSRDLLPTWPRNFWQKHLRRVSAGKQSILPELPRVRLDRTNFQRTSIFVSSSRDLRDADLEDLHRLTKEAYLKKFSSDLQGASLVEDLQSLPSPSKLKDASQELNWRLHYQSSQPESDGTWSFLARFLQLPEGSLPPMLNGVSKLLWGRGFLFLLASSSDLQARLRQQPGNAIAPEAFQEAGRPLLLAPNADFLAAERTGQSCSDFCALRGGFCAASDLVFANNCEAMRTVLFCERCERNMGADQPALASLRSSRSYGACLYNGDILHHPITCDAYHRETRRLCVCRNVKQGIPLKAASNKTLPANVESTSVAAKITSKATGTPFEQNPESNVKTAKLIAKESEEPKVQGFGLDALETTPKPTPHPENNLERTSAAKSTSQRAEERNEEKDSVDAMETTAKPVAKQSAEQNSESTSAVAMKTSAESTAKQVEERIEEKDSVDAVETTAKPVAKQSAKQNSESTSAVAMKTSAESTAKQVEERNEEKDSVDAIETTAKPVTKQSAEQNSESTSAVAMKTSAESTAKQVEERIEEKDSVDAVETPAKPVAKQSAE